MLSGNCAAAVLPGHLSCGVSTPACVSGDQSQATVHPRRVHYYWAVQPAAVVLQPLSALLRVLWQGPEWGVSYFSFQRDGVCCHTPIILKPRFSPVSTANFPGNCVEYSTLQSSQTAGRVRSRDFLHNFVIAIYFNKFELRINVRKTLKYLAEELPVHVSQIDTK